MGRSYPVKRGPGRLRGGFGQRRNVAVRRATCPCVPRASTTIRWRPGRRRDARMRTVYDRERREAIRRPSSSTRSDRTVAVPVARARMVKSVRRQVLGTPETVACSVGLAVTVVDAVAVLLAGLGSAYVPATVAVLT